ncbi:MAG: diguanylate cyclase [Anaerolineaceae bacterium]|jgi:diguanylate cyclase (GGDEF)-like protein|nr:MAG: diguanylate cyclase [Anaerolineaceae bacterium]
MEISLPIYLVSLGCLVVVIVGIGIRSFIEWRRPGARTLGLLMLSMSVWAGFYMLEIMHPSLPVKIAARKILYLGMSLSPAFWLGFAIRYTGFGKLWSKRGRPFFFAIPGTVAFLLGATNERHKLIWETMTSPPVQPGALILELGAGFWIFAIIACILLGIGMGVYLLVFLQSEKHLRVKTGIVLVGASITFLVNIFFLTGRNPPTVDLTPLSFIFIAPFLAFGFFRFGVFSLLPLASMMVMDRLQDAIIVVNTSGHATDINHAARELLGIETIQEGTPVFDILPQPERFKAIWDSPNTVLKLELKRGGIANWYETSVMRLQSDGQISLGWVIVLHDITAEQLLLKAEKRRSQQLALLEETGRTLADSFDEKEILQRAVNMIIQRFRYPEAAISILTEDNMLEVSVIAGTADFGYQPGFRQEMDAGIIGHTANIQRTYVSDHVASDPYYFSNDMHFGSAICTPIWKQGKLYGVLYVESAEPVTFDDLDVKTLETFSSQISASLQRASLHAETQESLRALFAMQTISKSIASSLDLETIAGRVVHGLKEAFGYSHVSIYLLEDDYLNLVTEVGYPEELTIEKIHISQGVIGRAIRTKTVQFIEDTTKENVFLKADDNIASEICIPLLKENAVLGALNVESNNMRKLTQTDVSLLSTLASPIAIAVDNARLHAQVKKLATTDAVTGLANRRVFEETLVAEVERARRLGMNVSLVIFDIDSFKEYNDTYGHPAGDTRLKAMAKMIQKKLRSYDLAARYGGDEFAIILSNTDRKDALAFAQRLHEASQVGSPHPPQNGLGVPGYTLSMGIATFPDDAKTHAELLVAADNAALRAKHLGKNRIQPASEL